MYLPRARPTRSLVIVLIILLGGLIFLWQQHPVWSSSRPALLAEQTGDEFWKSLSALLAAATPRCRPPKRMCKAKLMYWDDVHTATDTAPQKCLSMPESSRQAMRESHQTYVQGIAIPQSRMSYMPETRGLVTTAGTEYLPYVIISLRMLRKTGCQLPMEVFLSTERDWEPYICDTVLPSLNARCIVQSPHLRTTANNEPPSRYQSKIVSILTSSFSEVLFLDADCFPITDPTKVFTTAPFTTTGLVTFPDYWATTASPIYYSITQTPIPAIDKHQTTESGQLFISKPQHERSLLLALYYNHFGKKFYYPLLSQGAAGEGDKDTFLAAASFFNESYYQVRTGVKSLGHMVNDHMDGSAMVQYDPVEDYLFTTSSTPPADPQSNPNPTPHPMFIHNNFPKFNPRLLWTEHAHIITDPTTGAFRRPWTERKEVLDSFGFDVQKSHWREILWVACELEGKLWAWEGVDGICENTRKYVDEIFGVKNVRGGSGPGKE